MIALAADHLGLAFKEKIKLWLISQGYEVKDYGTFGPGRVDYCDFSFVAAESVAHGKCDRGLLFCGTGVGMAISANKVPGIRAVVCSEPYSAKLSREHNNTNILALGVCVVGLGLAKLIIDIWLNATFEGGRHAVRVNKIALYERSTG